MTIPDEQVHVVPTNDLREHEPDHRCWCRPDIKYVGVGVMVVHNSADGREAYEQGRKLH